MEQITLQNMSNDELLTNYWHYKHALPRILSMVKDPARVQGLIDMCMLEMTARNLNERSLYIEYSSIENGTKICFILEAIDEFVS